MNRVYGVDWHGESTAYSTVLLLFNGVPTLRLSIAIMHLQVNVDRLKDRIKAPLKKLSPKSASPDPDEEWKKPKSHHGAFGFFDNPVSSYHRIPRACVLLCSSVVPRVSLLSR